MKKVILLSTGLLFVAMSLHGQTYAPGNNAMWKRGGNSLPPSGLGNNVLGPMWGGSELWLTTDAGFNNRMVIKSSLDAGVIGFGDNLPVAFVPQDRLHSHINGQGDNMFRFTNPTTGLTGTDGFHLGVRNIGTSDIGLFDLMEQSLFRFDIQAQGAGPQITKFTIDNINQNNITTTFQPTYADATRVSIWEGATYVPSSPFTSPLAMLHIGSPNFVNGFGHRDWMNIGTYYNTTGSDGMYVGIKETGNNGMDAVVAWGDDGAAAGSQGDRLKFIFNSNFTPGGTFTSMGPDGLEVARMISMWGNDGAASFNGGSIGGLDPLNTVHIVGPSTSGTAATAGGNSGLRFEYLKAGITPTIANPGAGVLSVDANGDVIYVPGVSAGGPGLGNPCTSPPILNPLITSWEIPLAGNNFHFSDAPGALGSVSIGNLSCAAPFSRLDIINDSKPFAAFFQNTVNSAVATGALRLVNNNSGNGATGGAQATATTTGTGSAEGVQGRAQSSGGNAIGMAGISIGGAAPGNFAIGVNARSVASVASNVTIGVNSLAANGSSQSISGNFDVIGSSSPSNYGLQTEILGGTNAASTNRGYDGLINTPALTNSGIVYSVTGASSDNNGTIFTVSGTAPNHNGGQYFTSGATTKNFGFLSQVQNTSTTTISENWAIVGRADNPNTVNGSNIGVWGEAINSGAGGVSQSVGVIGTSKNASAATSIPGNSIGVYGEGMTSAAYFAGAITSGPALVFSDRNIKDNVKPIESGLDLLRKLNPVTYNYKSDEYKDLHLGNKRQYGFIAQEVEAVIPELVGNADKIELKNEAGEVISKGYELKGLNYDGIIPLLTKGIQEQQVIIETQDEKISDLQNQIDELRKLITTTPANSGTNGTTTYEVELSDEGSIVLDQNVPNPFAEQTVINYFIPEDAGRAQIVFYNASGQLIKAVDISEKGKGQLNVFANDLSNGLYTYALIVDGKVAGTKKMEKQK